MITPNQHEKNEWSRMAQAAYAADRNDIGHRYSTWASIRHNERMSSAIFDILQDDYRTWLISNNWPVRS